MPRPPHSQADRLEVESVGMSYSGKAALRQVSFSLRPGIYGLLGPNGSGKSTLMSIITGNLKASEGGVSWNGRDVSSLGGSYRALLGYVPQQGAYYPEFTATRFLHYMATLKGLPQSEARYQVPALLGDFGLADVADAKVKTFSGGMRQRLLIAQALLGQPRLLVLDEPTVGLDPRQRDSFRRLLSDGSEGRIVLISTHVVSDVEWVSSEVLLLRQGELIRKASREALVEEVRGLLDPSTLPIGRPLGLEDVYLHFFGGQEPHADSL